MSKPSGLNLSVIHDPAGQAYICVEELHGFLEALADSDQILTAAEAVTVTKVNAVLRQALSEGAEDRPVRLDWP